MVNFNKYRQKQTKMKVSGTSIVVPGNAYNQAVRPVLTFMCKDIIRPEDVSVWCSSGYIVEILTKLRNTVTCMVRYPDNPANIADHTHDILVAAAGGTAPMKFDTAGVELTNGAGGTILGSSKNSGVRNTTIVAATNPNGGGIELPTGFNAGFTIYGLAYGYN